ncbi:LysR family transcriptional regulator [Corallococcus sp. bb12-1]|uniref:LysR family transcriptional regulator n=1 Tax=Corallococcus sp. bb12-1 TaxID=2996784 RepID=UPI00226FB4F4|nr:LysR family transcriptional regulator [Corallococcus sp. bb12-1]MCY1040048.1 LysR family transcriptional regulator [Corallococcus sp. bb12-1]
MVQNPLPFHALQGFEAAARHLKFSRAAAELGITPTAMSKLIGQLEATLDVRLFHRTTRSVALTEAGQRLATSVGPALAQLRSGVEQAVAGTREAAGTLRINTSHVAWKMLLEPHLRGFIRACPRVQLDVSIDNVASDIVARGFDVGIRPGRGLQRDVVGVQLSGPQRLIVVGAPSYLAHAGTPKALGDLLSHDCIRQRLGNDRWLEWTLLERGKAVTTAVRGHLVMDEMRGVLGAAVEGNGLAYVFESFAASDLAAGRLKHVLERHALRREPFYLYYPNRQQMPLKLRAFIDFFRERNRAA